MPKRIQRKRTKGWKMPVGAKYVGRPTKFGNPYWVEDGNVMTKDAAGHPMIWQSGRCRESAIETAVNNYRYVVHGELLDNPNFLDELRGKDLACWCPLNQKCHADVLLEMANK